MPTPISLRLLTCWVPGSVSAPIFLLRSQLIFTVRLIIFSIVPIAWVMTSTQQPGDTIMQLRVSTIMAEFRLDMPGNDNNTKQCERCGREFQCMPGKISECRCSQVQLSHEERIFLKNEFSDCLCNTCLHDLKTKFASWNSKKS
ncbi:MAG: hypothetical protein EOO04_35285 [Chitinophagaceae bacterium]|nr:MAG: hypothetical protein EOO04_35285 [Chitinophagaceae bacterium]